MDTDLSFTRPIDEQFATPGLRTALAQAFKQVFDEVYAEKMQDLIDYGCPHLGSRTVIERFTKMDGLAVLRRPVTSDLLMRIIYANWSSLASERGLGFLEFVLQMLWANQWQIKRLWHRIDRATQYPAYLTDEEKPNHFLTSRIKIELDEDVEIPEALELAPIIRRLVPANIIVKINPKGLNKDFGDTSIGIAVIAKSYNIIDLS